MIARHEALRRRVQLELDHLEKMLPAIHRHWHKAKSAGPDQDAYINSVALNLHSFYSRLERRRPTLPRSCPRSTIGAEELNDRVRDGNGCV